MNAIGDACKFTMKPRHQSRIAFIAHERKHVVIQFLIRCSFVCVYTVGLTYIVHRLVVLKLVCMLFPSFHPNTSPVFVFSHQYELYR